MSKSFESPKQSWLELDEKTLVVRCTRCGKQSPVLKADAARAACQAAAMKFIGEHLHCQAKSEPDPRDFPARLVNRQIIEDWNVVLGAMKEGTRLAIGNSQVTQPCGGEDIVYFCSVAIAADVLSRLGRAMPVLMKEDTEQKGAKS